jgi:hypothetical protein
MAGVMFGDPEDPKLRGRPQTASLYAELLIVDGADRLKVPRWSSSATTVTAATSS